MGGPHNLTISCVQTSGLRCSWNREWEGDDVERQAMGPNLHYCFPLTALCPHNTRLIVPDLRMPEQSFP